ncbi:hypothetical protein B0H14DRAFT_3147831 [Mycena olivaceomarginata]|nr:hypothetical protein B0H14DRAFT_3147831 [Mycena olivaceomarginata]
MSTLTPDNGASWDLCAVVIKRERSDVAGTNQMHVETARKEKLTIEMVSILVSTTPAHSDTDVPQMIAAPVTSPSASVPGPAVLAPATTPAVRRRRRQSVDEDDIVEGSRQRKQFKRQSLTSAASLPTCAAALIRQKRLRIPPTTSESQEIRANIAQNFFSGHLATIFWWRQLGQSDNYTEYGTCPTFQASFAPARDASYVPNDNVICPVSFPCRVSPNFLQTASVLDRDTTPYVWRLRRATSTLAYAFTTVSAEVLTMNPTPFARAVHPSSATGTLLVAAYVPGAERRYIRAPATGEGTFEKRGIRVEKSIVGCKSEIRREGRRVICDRAGEGAFLGHKPGPLLQFPGSPIYNEFISDHPLRDMTNSRRRRSTQNKPRKIKSREDAVSARTLRYRKRVQAAINRDSKVGSETKKTKVLPLGNRSWLGANPYDNLTEVSDIWKMACKVRVWDFFMHSTSANSAGESRVSPFPFVPAKVLSEIFPSEVGVISWKGTPVDPMRRAA